jgi:hypothetical protein
MAGSTEVARERFQLDRALHFHGHGGGPARGLDLAGTLAQQPPQGPGRGLLRP